MKITPTPPSPVEGEGYREGAFSYKSYLEFSLFYNINSREMKNRKMKKMIIVIAGTSLTIQMDEAIAFFLTPLKDFFRGFLKPRGPTTARLTLSYNHLVTLRKFKAFPISLSQKQDRETLRVLRHVEKLYPFSEKPLLIGFLNGVLAYNIHSQRGHIYLFRSDGKNFILGSLHKLLFLFVAIIMTEQDKLTIHGAGLRVNSEGHLFLGASGAGKSTVAGQVERGCVLSDDAPVITQDGRLFTIHASPFSQVNLFDIKGTHHHRKEAPLTKLIFLNQANHLDLERREKRSALAELLRDHIHGFDFMDGDLKTRAFRFCCDLCTSVPAFDLYFQKNNQLFSRIGDQIPLGGGHTDEYVADAPAEHCP